MRSPLIVSVSMLRLPYHWVFVVGRHDDGDDDDGHDDRSRAGGLFSSAAPSFPGGRLISGKINKKTLQQRRRNKMPTRLPFAVSASRSEGDEGVVKSQST